MSGFTSLGTNTACTGGPGTLVPMGASSCSECLIACASTLWCLGVECTAVPWQDFECQLSKEPPQSRHVSYHEQRVLGWTNQ